MPREPQHPTGKRPTPPTAPPKAGLGLLGEIGASLKSAFPDIARLGAGLAFRTLASKPECVEMMAEAMCSDEEIEWKTLDGKEKRLWKLRARAALIGLDRYVAVNTAAASAPGATKG